MLVPSTKGKCTASEIFFKKEEEEEEETALHVHGAAALESLSAADPMTPFMNDLEGTLLLTSLHVLLQQCHCHWQLLVRRRQD